MKRGVNICISVDTFLLKPVTVNSAVITQRLGHFSQWFCSEEATNSSTQSHRTSYDTAPADSRDRLPGASSSRRCVIRSRRRRRGCSRPWLRWGEAESDVSARRQNEQNIFSYDWREVCVQTEIREEMKNDGTSRPVQYQTRETCSTSYVKPPVN